jgi:hypothetical protein
MASWKKILVSGSQIHVAGVTASNIQEGTNTDYILTYKNTTGEFRYLESTELSASFATSASFAQTARTADSASVLRLYVDETPSQGAIGYIPFATTYPNNGHRAFTNDGQLLYDAGYSKLYTLVVSASILSGSTANLKSLPNITTPSVVFYNPTLGTLTYGATSSISSATASAVNITDTPTGGDYRLVYVDGTGPGKALRSETGSFGPTWNASNNLLTVQTLTVNSTTNIGGNTTIDGNLTVNGDLTYLNVTDLYVEDRFIAVASGSTTGGVDGGIVVVSGSANIIGYSGPVGFGYAYDASADRWAMQKQMPLSGSGTLFTPDSYAVSARQAAGVPHAAAPTYGGASVGYGNIHVDSGTGDIYIYS